MNSDLLPEPRTLNLEPSPDSEPERYELHESPRYNFDLDRRDHAVRAEPRAAPHTTRCSQTLPPALRSTQGSFVNASRWQVHRKSWNQRTTKAVLQVRKARSR